MATGAAFGFYGPKTRKMLSGESAITLLKMRRIEFNAQSSSRRKERGGGTGRSLPTTTVAALLLLLGSAFLK
jgi:hypothetical protein